MQDGAAVLNSVALEGVSIHTADASSNSSVARAISSEDEPSPSPLPPPLPPAIGIAKLNHNFRTISPVKRFVFAHKQRRACSTSVNGYETGWAAWSWALWHSHLERYEFLQKRFSSRNIFYKICSANSSRLIIIREKYNVAAYIFGRLRSAMRKEIFVALVLRCKRTRGVLRIARLGRARWGIQPTR